MRDTDSILNIQEMTYEFSVKKMFDFKHHMYLH